MVRFRLGLLLMLLAQTGCGWFGDKEEQETEVTRKPLIVGEIARVHAKDGFVLIKRYGPGDLPVEGVFSSRSADGARNVNLNPTGEKLGRFYAADYSQDALVPRKGDVVVLNPTPESSEEPDLVEIPEKNPDPGEEPETLSGRGNSRISE